MAKGWIRLDRQIMEHWTYSDKPFNKSMAWIDLILLADHKTHKKLWRGKLTTFKRGDVNLSISALALRWGWSRNKARRFLLQLKEDNMINLYGATDRTTITIVKYGFFQGKRTADETTDETTNETTDETTGGAHLINNNNGNNNITSNSLTSEEVAVAEEKEKRDPDRLYPGDPGYNPDRLYPGDPNYTDIDWGDDE